MRRLLLYVHYNKFNGIDDHVIYQLKNIRHIYDEIVFISNSKFSSFDYNLLCQQVQIENFLQRKNEGFDFGGWKDGISLIGKDKIKTFDSVTFMNDTCYGPLWDILPQYSIYEEQIQTIDFWGMTSHPSFFSNRKIVPKHLQSYFIVFQGTVLKSQYFFQFWDEITLFETIEEAIEFGEIHLTQYFLEKKYRYSSLLESRTDQKRLGINISMEKPEILLENKIP
ncbi:TPA: rhamnan synthesis F family protein, partial [Streptococcus suis]